MFCCVLIFWNFSFPLCIYNPTLKKILLVVNYFSMGCYHSWHRWLESTAGWRQTYKPCRETLGIRVYLVGIGKGIKVRGYGGREEGGEREAGTEKKEEWERARRSRDNTYIPQYHRFQISRRTFPLPLTFK